MSIKAGDLVVVMRAADGQVMGYKLTAPGKAGDLAVPFMTADSVPVGLKVVPMNKAGDVGFAEMAADGVLVALKCATGSDEYMPIITKVCSGPGNGMVGEWRWTNESDHTQGIDIGYQTIMEHYIGHVPYRVDTMLGPIICPYGDWYCRDARWYVRWERAPG